MSRIVPLLLALVLVLGGCKKAPTVEASVEPPKVGDATTGLMLTWVDEKGEFHTEEKATDVPAAARDIVRVRVLDGAAAPPDREFVADLRAAGPDGNYPVKVVPRADFEDVAVQRRAKHGSVLAPKVAASGSAAPAGSGAIDPSTQKTVIIYGASWCGPCHQAAAYLRQKGVPFVEHDIEEDPHAQREMRAKLEQAGKRGGSIPVLDVRGRILVGFDPRAVDQALADR